MKRLILLIITSAVLLMGCGGPSQDDLDLLSKDNETLTQELDDLKIENASLNDQIEDIEALKTIHKQDLDAILKEHEKEIKDLNNKYLDETTAINEKNDSLEDKIHTLETEITELKNELAQAKTSEKKPEATTNSTNQKNTSTSSAKESSNCDIKGSVNGIYHTPGSTYYSRTTNVVQWFCTEEEAKNAGYRAPKR